MLKLLSESEIAADVRVPSGIGACALSATAGTAQPNPGSGAVARPRPYAFWAADAFGPLLRAAATGIALGQRDPGSQHKTMTRTAAASGAAKGPHPEREPVPV